MMDKCVKCEYRVFYIICEWYFYLASSKKFITPNLSLQVINSLIDIFTEKLLEDKDVVYILIDDFAIVTNQLISNTDGYTIYEALSEALEILVDYYKGRKTYFNGQIERCI
jgi:DNA-binding ferritin-like protein (Dps family)